MQNDLAGIVYICTHCWDYRIPDSRALIDAIPLWGNKIRDLLVLVGGDGGEDSLREAECLNSLPTRHRLVWRQFAAEVLPDDVDTGLILVHGVEDDLKKYEKDTSWSGANIVSVIWSNGVIMTSHKFRTFSSPHNLFSANPFKNNQSADSDFSSMAGWQSKEEEDSNFQSKEINLTNEGS